MKTAVRAEWQRQREAEKWRIRRKFNLIEKASDKFHLISLSALKFNMSEPSSSWVEQRFGSLLQFRSAHRKCQLFIRFASPVERFWRTCRLKSGWVIWNKVRNPGCLLFGFTATPFDLTTFAEDAPGERLLFMPILDHNNWNIYTVYWLFRE